MSARLTGLGPPVPRCTMELSWMVACGSAESESGRSVEDMVRVIEEGGGPARISAPEASVMMRNCPLASNPQVTIRVVDDGGMGELGPVKSGDRQRVTTTARMPSAQALATKRLRRAAG